jgi:hypothetical protein
MNGLPRLLPFEINVDIPCNETWSEMRGSSQVRHCSSCDRQVHDFAAMTPRQIDRLVAESGGHLCGRITRREDGSLVTLEPTTGRARLAAVGLSLALGVAPMALAQSGAPAPPASFSLSGTVKDIQGGAIAGSKIILMRGATAFADVATDGAGQFSVLLPAGKYELRVTAEGFSHFSAFVSTNSENAAVAEVTLKPAMEVNLQVTTTPATLDATTGGELSIDYGPWYRRLWFHLRHPVLYVRHIF